MQLMQTYSVLTKGQYSRIRSFFRNNSETIGEKFGNYRYNAVKRAIDGVDPTHLNDLIHSSRGVGRYRETIRVINAMKFPFKREKDTFIAHVEMNKTQKAKMRYLSLHWEGILSGIEMHEEVKLNTPKAAWGADNSFDKWAKTAEHKGINVIDFMKAKLAKLEKESMQDTTHSPAPVVGDIVDDTGEVVGDLVAEA